MGGMVRGWDVYCKTGGLGGWVGRTDVVVLTRGGGGAGLSMNRQFLKFPKIFALFAGEDEAWSVVKASIMDFGSSMKSRM